MAAFAPTRREPSSGDVELERPNPWRHPSPIPRPQKPAGDIEGPGSPWRSLRSLPGRLEVTQKPARDSVEVMVSTLSSETQYFDLKPHTTVLELKEAIADQMLIPIVLQRVISCGRERHDLECIVGAGDECFVPHVSYTVLICFEKMRYQMSRGSSRQRFQALPVLSQWGCRGGEMAIAAVCDCLKDENRLVRDLAVNTLAQIAKGDQYAITAACNLLESGQRGVRQAAVAALAEVANQGDMNVITVVCTCLNDEDAVVRHAALMALAHVAEKGNQHAVIAVTDCLDDEDPDVRNAAANALAKVVHGFALRDRIGIRCR